jgi:KipI family sensor histidine kinase inhibitor
MSRLRDAGDAAVLLELDGGIDPVVSAKAVAIADTVRRAARDGIRDVVATYRSVAVYFDPLRVDADVLRRLLQRAEQDATAQPHAGRFLEVPVMYGGALGPDLEEVATFAGLRPHQVIERHAGVEYRVYLLGFLPGFAYMGLVRPEIAIPRRATPRLRVEGGSVGIAGAQTAIYPRASPGGWQIIGRSPMPVFDPAADPPAVFAPGDRVRFVPTPPSSGAFDRAVAPAPQRTGSADTRTQAPGSGARALVVTRPGLFTTVQDCGRWGHQSSGVPVSGALDLLSHRMANALVGNDGAAATIEVTLSGPELRMDGDATIAISGADLGATCDGASVPLDTATRVRRGATLRFGERRGGARAYVAVDGGIAVPSILGSRATHAGTALGGLDGGPLTAGDRLPLGPRRTDAMPRRRVSIGVLSRAGGARVRVLPGPQDDCFADDAFEALERTRFSIAPQSNRMGYRLVGARVPRRTGDDMISDATFVGAIQVPSSGEPILLMADRQTTGGYPQIATVISADLPLAAQLAPGDWIEFTVCSRADALAALVAQEGKLLAIG